eukprot:COSAG06_NODE_295_length_18175_cov_9.088017_17_plen_76_part_00
MAAPVVFFLYLLTRRSWITFVTRSTSHSTRPLLTSAAPSCQAVTVHALCTMLVDEYFECSLNRHRNEKKRKPDLP